MNKIQFINYIAAQYGIAPDTPWAEYPNYFVFRHPDNKKWFALIMDVPRSKLGIGGDGNLDVVNLKCDPFLIVSLRADAGIFPAYHMNKDNWITVALDDSVEKDKLTILSDMSYQLTSQKPKASKRQR